MRARKILLPVVIGLAGLIVVGGRACGAQSDLQSTTSRRTVRITGLIERTRPFLESLIATYKTALPDFDFQIVPASGALEFVEFVQDGRADIGLASSDQAYAMYLDDLAGHPQLDRLRGIAALWVLRIHLLAGRTSPVHHVADLRGRRIGHSEVLTPLAGIRLILIALGIELSDVDLKRLHGKDLAAGLTHRSLDAAFVTAGMADPAVHEALAAGARLIPIEGPAVKRLREDYPFFRLTTIPAGTYQASPGSTKTLGVPGAIICRRDLPERLVYDLTKQFFEFLSAASTRPVLPFFPIESAPAVAVPLHDGAARYYRERELFR
jgi:TRAP transporter TAXI family solute receptor